MTNELNDGPTELTLVCASPKKISEQTRFDEKEAATKRKSPGPRAGEQYRSPANSNKSRQTWVADFHG